MNPKGVYVHTGVGHDIRMPALALSNRISARRSVTVTPPADSAELAQALKAARWPGVALPPTMVFDSAVIPVVSYTGARHRVERGEGPVLDLETVRIWEAFPTPTTPPPPLRITGFIATAKARARAVRQVASLSGLGAGMVISRHQLKPISLLDADASGVWVVGVSPAESSARVWVTGRAGAVSTARRVPLTRLMEEALFELALRHDLLEDAPVT